MAMSDSQKWLLLATTILLCALLYVLRPVLTPFLIGALFAYLGDPLVDRLEAWKLGTWRLGRTLGVVVVFAAMTLILVIGLLFVLPLVERQAVAFVSNIPDVLDWLQRWLAPRIATILGGDVAAIDIEAIREALRGHWRQVGSVAGQLVQQLSRSGQVVLIWTTYLVLIPVVTFYLLRDWDLMVAAIRNHLPQKIEPAVSRLAREIDAVLAEFLRGQITVMLALATIYCLGLWLVGLELALLIGLVAGLVSFVPYLGVIVGVIAASAAALIQFHDTWHLLGVTAVFVVGQILEGMVLSPWLVGDRVGLHPVAVIFAVLAGGQLFGFFGVLLALPVAAVLVVLLRHSRDEYLGSSLFRA